MNLRPWLALGIGIKRWLFVAFAGMVLLALAAAHVIRQATRDVEPSGVGGALLDLVTLQALPYPVRGLIAAVVGVGLVALGAVRVIRALTDPLRADDRDRPLVELIYQKRFLARGPRIVAIGGGTGLSALLRGLKEHSSNLTAVVTVADDGGSSGVLRDAFGIPAVGDLRNCIAALADNEELMADLLQYRFPAEDGASGHAPAPVPDAASPVADPGATTVPAPAPVPAPAADGPSLAGHPMGNLLLAALTALEEGDFEEGVRRMNRVLAVRGRVVPVSGTPIVLHAALEDGRELAGQSVIMRAEGVQRVWIEPDDVAPTDEALAAIAAADLIVIGPGSLYTSLLPSLLIGRLAEAVVEAPGLRVYVCNVATQLGETSGYDLADHVEALARHTRPGLLDLVLANNRFDARIPEGWPARPVHLRWPPSVEAPPSVQAPPRLVLDDVVDGMNAHRHDPAKLAAALMRLVERDQATRRRTGEARTPQARAG